MAHINESFKHITKAELKGFRLEIAPNGYVHNHIPKGFSLSHDTISGAPVTKGSTFRPSPEHYDIGVTYSEPVVQPAEVIDLKLEVEDDDESTETKKKTFRHSYKYLRKKKAAALAKQQPLGGS